MVFRVQKFGGTSVGTPERIRQVAERVAQSYFQGDRLVIVVSAMGYTTDELISLAHQVSHQPPYREMDMLLTVGERITMALLSMALSDLKVPALSLTGSQTGIMTDRNHRRARICSIQGGRVKEALAQGKVAIVAGFQGVSEEKEVTTLGRGGSDTSAVALAAALKADTCEIFTDVEGVYSTDPRALPEAKQWKVLPYDLMVEMAVRGAGVLHPRSIELAKEFGVFLEVKSSFKDLRHQAPSSIHSGEGTLLMAREKLGGMEEFQITGVVADFDQFMLTIDLNTLSGGGIHAVCRLSDQEHLSMISPFFSKDRFVFFSNRDFQKDWEVLLKSLVADQLIKDYQFHLDWVPLSVVGDRFSQDGRAIAEVFNILAHEKIETAYGSASALAMTVGVLRQCAKEGVRAIHDYFFKI